MRDELYRLRELTLCWLRPRLGLLLIFGAISGIDRREMCREVCVGLRLT